jgi:hypothetical protein
MNKGYILLQAPRPAGEARATSIPVVYKERATTPAGLRAAARRGAAPGGHLLRCRSSKKALRRKQWRQIRAFDCRQTKLFEYAVDRGERYLARRRNFNTDRLSASADVHNNARVGKHCSIALLARTPRQIIIGCNGPSFAESNFKIVSSHFLTISRG